jgi:DNA-binding transcriptional LysR family regulator
MQVHIFFTSDAFLAYWTTMDTDLLRTFAEVARQGSVTRAARLLRLQQPTVSHRLAALERAVGAPLFERLGNALALTAAGEALLPYARQVPAVAGEALDAARAAAGLAARRLHIGCAETPATYLLPSYLRALRQGYPDLQIRLTVGNAARVLAVTVSGEVDVALLTEREEHSALHGETFRRDHFVVAVAVDDPWATRERVDAAELATRRLLLREVGAGTRAYVDETLRDAGAAPSETLEVASLEAIKRMAEARAGVAVVPGIAVEREAAEGRLRVLALDAPANSLAYRLMWHKDKAPVPGVALLRAVIGL